MSRRKNHLLIEDGGAAAVEFGLVSILFVTLLIGTIQFGFTFWEYVQVAQAARVGARWAALGQAAQVVPRARAAAPGLDPAQLTITVGTGGSTDSVRVTVSYPTTLFAPLPAGGVLPARITSVAEQRTE